MDIYGDRDLSEDRPSAGSLNDAKDELHNELMSINFQH
jgi:hypothetical protein